MTPVTETLPDLDCFTSRSLMMLIDGQRYVGHYHANGWFYIDEHGCDIRMAYGPKAEVAHINPDKHKPVTAWEYMRPASPVDPLAKIKETIAFEKAQRSSYFTVGDVMSANCASLDLLTPLHEARMGQLPLTEQSLVYDIVARMANHPVGDHFTSAWLRESSGAHKDLSTLLARLVEKKVLSKNGNKFRFLSPGFELWMRLRSLAMSEYYAFGNSVCPVLLRDDSMLPAEFWAKFCEEAGVDMPILPIRKQSPPYQPSFQKSEDRK